MSLLTRFPDHERLQWKLALLRYRPADLPSRRMPYFLLGAMQQRAVQGDVTMPAHWEEAVMMWHSRGFTPHTYLVLHNTVDDLAGHGHHIPASPAVRTEKSGAGSTGGPAGPWPAPHRGGPRHRDCRSWGGRPGIGPHALNPEDWAGAAEWIGSAVREIVLDVLAGTEGQPPDEPTSWCRSV